jgi:hypothetical protein
MKNIDEAIGKTMQHVEIIAKTSDNMIRNMNFPFPMTAETPEDITTLRNITHGKDVHHPVYCALHSKQGETYRFAIEKDLFIPPPPGSDIHALLQRKISHSIIDLRRLCVEGEKICAGR